MRRDSGTTCGDGLAALWYGANHDDFSIDLKTRRAFMTEPVSAPMSPKRRWPLALSALGVVYGDIGTSPLYALRESLGELYEIPVTPDNIHRSSIAHFLVLDIGDFGQVRAVRHAGRPPWRGRILALTALVMPHASESRTRRRALLALGLFGTALLYGDGMITPAISVLSAVEGLEVATPVLTPYVVPLAMVILVLLLVIQHRSTGTIGKWFGPIVLLWLVTLAVLCIGHIAKQPGVLAP
jgi:KUP system potassium uptake protein